MSPISPIGGANTFGHGTNGNGRSTITTATTTRSEKRSSKRFSFVQTASKPLPPDPSALEEEDAPMKLVYPPRHDSRGLLPSYLISRPPSTEKALLASWARAAPTLERVRFLSGWEARVLREGDELGRMDEEDGMGMEGVVEIEEEEEANGDGPLSA
jgi:hypothetical protein